MSWQYYQSNSHWKSILQAQLMLVYMAFSFTSGRFYNKEPLLIFTALVLLFLETFSKRCEVEMIGEGSDLKQEKITATLHRVINDGFMTWIFTQNMQSEFTNRLFYFRKIFTVLIRGDHPYCNQIFNSKNSFTPKFTYCLIGLYWSLDVSI